jgi:DMSO/TMAO reductase YedYZ molybdopterin-dependent catalytic subunit
MNIVLTFLLITIPLSDRSTGNGFGAAFGGTATDNTDRFSLRVTNEVGKTTVISAERIAKLPQQTVTAKDHAGAIATYSGVALAEILRAADVKLGKDLKGALLANCLLIQAADGYRVVFSLVEVDPSTSNSVVLVADQKNSKPLDAKEGPYRLVVPSDKHFSRWVRQVTEISVEQVAKPTPKSR